MAERVVSVRLQALTDQYRAAMAGAASATDGLTKTDRWHNVGRAASQLGDTLTRRVTLPLLAVGVAAVKMATDFDSEMLKMTTLAGVAADEVDGMRDSILNLAGETGRAPKELADAMFFIRSAGLEGSDAMEVLDRSARMAALGMGETKVMADLLTGVMQVYGADTISAAEAADIFAAAVENSKTEVGAVADAVTKTVPTADALGVSFRDVSAALAAMATTNSNMNRNATQLQGLFSQLIQLSPEFRERLKGIGIDGEALRDMLSHEGGLVAAMKLLWEATDGNATAFAGLFPNVEAGLGALSLAANDFTVLDGVMANMTDTTGQLDNSFSTWAESMGAKNALAFGKFQVAMIRLGDILIPIAAQVVDFAAAFLDAFSGLPDPVLNVIVAVGLLAAAIGPLLSIGGRLIMLGTTITKTFQAIWRVASAVVAPTQSAAGGLNAMGASAGTAASKGQILAASLGGLGIALGVGTIIAGVTMQLQANAEAAAASQARVDALTDALEQSGGAFTDQAKEVLGSSVVTDAHRSLLTQMGVTVDDLADALAGGDEAWKAFNDAVMDGAESAGTSGLMLRFLETYMGQVKDETDRATDAFATNSEFTTAAGEASSAAAGGLEEMAEGATTVTEEFETLSEAVQAYNDALAETFDPVLGFTGALRDNEQAAVDLEAAQTTLDEAIAEHGPNSAEAAAATRDLDQATEDYGMSALDVEASARVLEAAIQDEPALLDAAKAALDRWAEEGLITQEVARELGRKFDDAAGEAGGLTRRIDNLNKTKDPRISVTHNMQIAQSAAQGLKGSVDAIPTHKQVSIQVAFSAVGNLAAAAAAGIGKGKQKFHSGGVVPGRRGQEIAAVLLGQEEVLAHDDPRHANNLVDMGPPSPHQGFPVGGSAPIQVTFNASDRIGRALMNALGYEVRTKYRGDVQLAFGQGAR